MPNYKRPDFKRIRDQVPIEDVCNMLGIELKRKGGALRGNCLICNHPSPRVFTVSPFLNRFWCFGFCRNGGDVIELVAQVRQISNYDAAAQLDKLFNSS